MIRILDIPISEIALDPEAASTRVDAAAERQGGMLVVGLGRVGDRVLLFLEELHAFQDAGSYRFAPFEGVSEKELIGEVGSRYTAGFSTVGVFPLGETLWGLFRKTGESAK